MKRRQYLKTLGAASVVSTHGFIENFTLRTPDGVSPLVESGHRFFRWSVPSDDVIMRFGNPSWILELDGDREESLEEWSERDEGRELIAFDRGAEGGDWDEDDGWALALISCPYTAAESLITKTWVTHIDLDFEAEYAEPVSPLGGEWVSFGEDFGVFESFRVNERHLDNGLAFNDDMEEGTMGDVLDVTDALDEDGSGYTVAVIDTGLNQVDEEDDDNDQLFGDRVLSESWNAIDDTTLEEDSDAIVDGNGHGTFVTAQIASGAPDPYQGYVPGADILAIKALSDDGSGEVYNIARAIRYAADEGADVVCLSLGSSIHSDAVDRAVSYALGADTLSIAAAGNDRGGTRWVAHPANAPDAITVSAGTIDEPEEAKVGYFSNHGPHPGTTDMSSGATVDASPDIVAPGCEIETETVDTVGNVDTSTLTGTSMAAPCVAGAAIQVMASEGLEEPDEIREKVLAGAEMEAAGDTEDGGNGMLNVANSVDEDESGGSSTDTNADSRDVAHNRLSNAQGRRLAGFL